jgi:hypothetical protein
VEIVAGVGFVMAGVTGAFNAGVIAAGDGFTTVVGVIAGLAGATFMGGSGFVARVAAGGVAMTVSGLLGASTTVAASAVGDSSSGAFCAQLKVGNSSKSKIENCCLVMVINKSPFNMVAQLKLRKTMFCIRAGNGEGFAMHHKIFGTLRVVSGCRM